MRITLNLASWPFFELRPLLLRLRILAAALVGLAIVLFFFLQIAERKAAKADAAVRNWTVATQNLQREWTMDQSLMREPVNAATLDRSEFLNQQFARKSFSWTTALMDLELVLPQGVQVISIDPRMTKEGHVLVRLRVNGPRDKAVELVSNLEKSPHFLDPRVAGEAAEVEGQNRAGFRPTMSPTIDENVEIIAEFNAGDLASTDKKAEETKSGTHAMGETEPANTAAASRDLAGNAQATSPSPAMSPRMGSQAGRRGNTSHGMARGAAR